MIAIFAVFLAVVAAAPHDSDSVVGSKNALSENFAGDIFDTSKFWRELETEMHRMEEMMQDFAKHFPSTIATAGIQGNKYVVTVSLTGFDEKDIVVKARDGALIIQAAHKEENDTTKSFMDLRTLPSDVNPSGSWTYDKHILKITFPLTKKEGDSSTEAVTAENSSGNAEEDTTHPVDLKNEVELVPVKY